MALVVHVSTAGIYFESVPLFPNFPLLLFCSQFRGQEPKKKYHQLSQRKQPLKVLYISTGILWILSSLTPTPQCNCAKIIKSDWGWGTSTAARSTWCSDSGLQAAASSQQAS